MIKFRAWDKVQKIMMATRDMWIDSDGNIFYVEAMGPDGEYDEGDLDVFKLEQFTGLKDVNGKDIYEGDIVQPVRPDTKSKIGKPFKVQKGNYVYGKWIARSIADNGYGVIDWHTGDELVVIGSSHENPELLEDENED